SGLARRPSQRELGSLVTHDLARRFHGSVVVHDVEDPGLVPLDGEGGRLAVSRALVETDLVLTVSAAESVVHGGPGLLRAAGGASVLRAAAAQSLLETSASRGWEDAVAVERALARRVPVLGLSVALNLPRFGGTLRGYPYDPAADMAVARSTPRRLAGLVPSPL